MVNEKIFLVKTKIMQEIIISIVILCSILILLFLIGFLFQPPCNYYFGISTGLGCVTNEYGEPIDCCD